MRTVDEIASALISWLDDRRATTELRPYLVALLKTYGDARALAERERCADILRSAADKLRSGGADDPQLAAMQRMCVKLLDNAVAAVLDS